MLARIIPWLSWTVVAAAAPRARSPQDTTTHRESSTIDTTLAFTTSGGVVDLSLTSTTPLGDISVTGWSRPQVRIHATSEDAPIRFEASATRVLLEVREQRGAYRRHGRNEGRAQFVLEVPVGTRVLMHSVSADLHAHGIKGELEARTVSGDIDASDATGRTTLESVSGNIAAHAITGPLHADAVSGDVEISAVTGEDIEVSTVSGDISLPNSRAKVVHTESVSGPIVYGGPIDPAGHYDFHSHSGDITLRLPADTKATLSLETFSGSIQAKGFSIPMQDDDHDHRGRRVDATLGGGGAQITIETFSGDITIEQGS